MEENGRKRKETPRIQHMDRGNQTSKCKTDQNEEDSFMAPFSTRRQGTKKREVKRRIGTT